MALSRRTLKRGNKTKVGRLALRKMDAECASCRHPWGEHRTLRAPHACETCEDCPEFVPTQKRR